MRRRTRFVLLNSGVMRASLASSAAAFGGEMGQVYVVLHGIKNRSELGSVMPVLDARPLQSQLMTSGPVSAPSTIEADQVENRYWTVVGRSGDTWIRFGASPTAEVGKGWPIRSGEQLTFAVAEVGEKFAILNG